MKMNTVNETELWGYIPKKVKINDISKQISNDVILGSIVSVPMKRIVLNTDKSDNPVTLKLDSNEVNPDEKILQTINLARHCDKMKNCREFSLHDDWLRELNSVEHYDVIQFIRKRQEKKFNHLAGCRRNCLDSILDNVPEISSETAYQLLRKAIATMLVFYGFTDAAECSLNVLTEVTETYLKKVCHLLAINSDKFALCNENYGFQDALDRTCHEVGAGGIKNLLDFYQESVIKRMEEVCQEYSDLKLTQPLPNEVNMTQKIINGSADEADNFDVPELHVSNNELMLTNSFETGYQMLQKLENNTQTVDFS